MPPLAADASTAHLTMPMFVFADLQIMKVIAARLALAAAMGLMLGIGRERLRKTAGMRTHMVVCVGSAIFVLAGLLASLSIEGCSRVIQGIIQGVGFLGAGTIIKMSDRAEVKGLTTAASTWLTAAVGVACGLGDFWLAIIGTSIAWFVLVPLGALERRWELARQDAAAATGGRQGSGRPGGTAS
jgi:putative Mg2+ transporter-C (MgtC) family protein